MLPGSTSRTSGEAAPGVWIALAAARQTITSPASSTRGAGASVATASTSAPFGVASTLYPACLQRDGGRHLLRARHLAKAFLVRVLERRPWRNDLVARHERGPVGPGERKQPLDPGRPAHRDVDVVDGALASAGRLLAFDLHLARRRGWRCSGRRDSRGTGRTTRSARSAAATAATLQRSPSPADALTSGEPVQQAAVDRHDRAADVRGLLRREEARRSPRSRPAVPTRRAGIRASASGGGPSAP